MWAGTTNWTASNKTYTSGNELSSNTAIVSVTLGNGTWTYNSGRSGVYVASREITKTDGIPTGGGYIVIEPVIDINFSLSTYSSYNNVNLVMIEASAPETVIKDFRQKGSCTNNFGKLEAGKTYYIYGHNFKETEDLDYVFYKSFTAKSYENCTINYKYESETIKSEVVNNYIGSTVTASMTSLWNDGGTTKYYVADDATTSFTVAESGNTFEVKLRLAATDAIATVNAIDGNSTILKSFTATGIEGETGTVFYTRAVYNGAYYTVPAVNNTTNGYAKTNVVYGGDPVTVTYTLDETISYYTEVENNLSKSRNEALTDRYAVNDVPERASGGAWYTLYGNDKSGGAYVWTPSGALSPGVYSLLVSGRNRTSSADNIDIKVRDSNGTLSSAVANLEWNGSTMANKEVSYILVPENASIAICNPKTSNNNICIDYIIITKLYDVTDASNVIGAVDYSSEFMGDYTDVTISKGQKVKFTFNNHGKGDSNWNNWLLRLSGTSGVDQTLRADNYVIGDDGSIVSTRSITEDGNAINWSDFLEDMKDASVVLTASYDNSGMFSVVATSTGSSHTYVHNFAYKEAKSGDITMELGVEKAWLEVSSIETTVSGTITPAGWASFSSSYPLDLSTITGGTAYYASAASGSTVTLTPTGDVTVPAGEGIMVKGTPNATFTINVAASGTAIDGNLLKGQTTTSEVAASTSGAYHYVFGYKKPEEVVTEYGFYNLATATTVPAGKAYLETTTALTSAPNAPILFSFDDNEITGVKAIDNGQLTIDNYYNLAGQRVAQPTKGLYIVNGKKYVVK